MKILELLYSMWENLSRYFNWRCALYSKKYLIRVLLFF